MQVKRDDRGVPIVYSIPNEGQGNPLVKPEENVLRVVYDMRPLTPRPWDDFTTVRERAEREWHAMAPYKNTDPLSPQIMTQIRRLKPVGHMDYCEQF